MRVTPWLIGAAAAAIIGFAGTAASAAPATVVPGLKAAASDASAVEETHYRRRWRRHWGFYGVPYVYFGPRYYHRHHYRPYYGAYGFYGRPWVGSRRYWW
jgi:hypothetical protein